MEKQSFIPQRELSGGRIIHLTRVLPENEPLPEDAMEVSEVKQDFVFGDSLLDSDRVVVDKQAVHETLPRPGVFGNDRLALLAILDVMPPGSGMKLEIFSENTQPVAAD